MKIVLRGGGKKIVLRQTGRRGPAGAGLPTGGTTGQVPVKQSAADYDIAWETPPTAPVTSVNGQTGVVVLDAADVGADVAGSAAQALMDANEYTDEQLEDYVAKGELVLNVKDFGAVGDGVTDDSGAINAALAGGGKTVYIPGGEYSIKSYIRVYADTHIILDVNAVLYHDMTTGTAGGGHAALILNGEVGNSDYATGYDGDGNITIEGGTIDCRGTTTSLDGTQAIAFAHARNIAIRNLRLVNNKQDHFIEINSSENVIIESCTFKDTTLTSAGSREAVNIDHSYSGGFPHFGSWDGTECKNVTVADCHFESVDLAAGTHAVPTNPHTGIRFSGNYIKDAVTAAFSGQAYDGPVITDNTIIDGCSVAGIRAMGTMTNISISNNTILNPTGLGIWTNAIGGSISNNSIRGGTRGIQSTGTAISITGNMVRDSSESGIYVSNYGQRITSNYVVNVPVAIISEANYASISSNTLYDFTDTGVRVLSSVNNDMITNNQMQTSSANSYIDASTVASIGSIVVYGNRTTGSTITGTILLPSGGITRGLDIEDNRIISGEGSPSGVVTAPAGSLYMDKAATHGITLWTKRSGTGNTGWARIQNASTSDWWLYGISTTSVNNGSSSYVEIELDTDYKGVRAEYEFQTGTTATYQVVVINSDGNAIPMGTAEIVNTLGSGVSSASENNVGYFASESLTDNQNVRGSFFITKSGTAAWGRGGYEYRRNRDILRIGSVTLNNGSFIRRIRLVADATSAFVTPTLRVEVRE